MKWNRREGWLRWRVDVDVSWSSDDSAVLNCLLILGCECILILEVYRGNFDMIRSYNIPEMLIRHGYKQCDFTCNLKQPFILYLRISYNIAEDLAILVLQKNIPRLVILLLEQLKSICHFRTSPNILCIPRPDSQSLNSVYTHNDFLRTHCYFPLVTSTLILSLLLTRISV